MKYFIVDRNTDCEIADNLKAFGRVILSSVVPDLYEPVNTHPDIQLHFFTDNFAVCCPELFEYYKTVLPDEVNLICGNNKAGGGYPFDASYNVAAFGNNLVCNIKYTEKIILDYYEKLGYNIIDVNQGYTKCNICIVSDSAIITEDKGIAEALKKNSADVCYINKGEVKLKNFNYGFIGGATGNIEKNKIVFAGDIKLHPEYNKISEFVSKYNSEIISLSKDSISDIGSIFEFNV